MRRPHLLIVFAVGCAMFCVSRSASAQQGYRPSRPTLSPYLNLYRTDSGIVDNYNAFVRPNIAMRSALQQQQSALTRQGMNIGTIQQYISGQQRGAARARTTAGAFMDFMHYYPGANASRGAMGRRR